MAFITAFFTICKTFKLNMYIIENETALLRSQMHALHKLYTICNILGYLKVQSSLHGQCIRERPLCMRCAYFILALDAFEAVSSRTRVFYEWSTSRLPGCLVISNTLPVGAGGRSLVCCWQNRSRRLFFLSCSYIYAIRLQQTIIMWLNTAHSQWNTLKHFYFITLKQKLV